MAHSAPSIARLFHSIVVVGTALSGCGGAAADDEKRPPGEQPDNDTNRSPAAGDPGASATTASAATPAQVVVAPGASSTETAIAMPVSPSAAPAWVPPATPAEMPREPSDCRTSQQFQCEDWERQSGCFCDDTAPYRASDCELSIQFVCAMEESETDPYGIGPVGCRCDTSRPQPELCERPEQYQCSVGLSSWFECYCDEQAPLSQEDCEGSSQFFYCQSQDPIYGCICITGIR